jgi:hypothetical protein
MSDEIIDRLARIETKQDALMESIEKITYTVYGNGKPGLLQEVAIIKTKIDERTEAVGMSRRQVLSITGVLSVCSAAILQWMSNHLGVK